MHNWIYVAGTGMTKRSDRQKFSIGYHLNSWDLAGLPLREPLEFLNAQGFRWFEMLAWTTLSEEHSRKYLQFVPQAPMKFSTDTDLLRRYAVLSEAQSELGIRLSSLYVNATFTNPLVWPYERDTLVTILRVLKGFGSPILVLGGGPSEAIDGPHEPQDYKNFCRALEEIGSRSLDLGIQTVFHPHIETFVERRDQLDRVMDEIDASVVGLCIDPAHFVLNHSDPVDALKVYASAVRYMHFKDTNVSPGLKRSERYREFCALGAGVVDFPALVDALLDNDYAGIALIELDLPEKSAEESAVQSIRYIRDTLGLELNPISAEKAK